MLKLIMSICARARRVAISLALTGVLIGSTACQPAAPPTVVQPSPSPGIAGGCSVKVGIITSLSGPYAQEAEELVRGYNLAQDDINATGGVLGCPLELVVRDDASQPDKVEAIVKELVEQSQVLLVIGSFSSQVTLQLVPAASRYQTPLLAHSATHFLITNLGYEWVFRTLPPVSLEIDALVDYALSQPLETQTPRMAVVYHNMPAGHSLAVETSSKAKRAGVSLVASEFFEPGASDFQPVMERVANADPDIVIFSASLPEDALGLMKAARLVGLNPQVYLGMGAFSSPAFLQQGAYADYFISATPWISQIGWQDEAGQTAQDFVEKFAARYGAEPTYHSVDAYVNVYLAQYAIEHADVTELGGVNLTSTRAAVRAVLRGMNLQQTLMGPIRFDANGQNNHLPVLVQNIGGQLIVISPESLSTGQVVFPAPTWKERYSVRPK